MISLNDEEKIKSNCTPYEWETYWIHIFNVMKKYKVQYQEKIKKADKQRGPYKKRSNKGYS